MVGSVRVRDALASRLVLLEFFEQPKPLASAAVKHDLSVEHPRQNFV